MSLTYEDVRTVLALIDGHTGGTAHLQQGELCVTVQSHAAAPRGAPQMPVPAPAVGRFRRADAAAGAAVEEGAVIGTVRSGRRDTPVLAPFGGTVGGFAAEDGDFVEFGQPVATIAGREAT